VPIRSETKPDTTPPAPITIQLKSPMAPMPERLQPIDSSEETLRHEVAVVLSRTGMSKSSATTIPAASVTHAPR
jgi:hypothetical protein